MGTRPADGEELLTPAQVAAILDARPEDGHPLGDRRQDHGDPCRVAIAATCGSEIVRLRHGGAGPATGPTAGASASGRRRVTCPWRPAPSPTPPTSPRTPRAPRGKKKPGPSPRASQRRPWPGVPRRPRSPCSAEPTSPPGGSPRRPRWPRPWWPGRTHRAPSGERPHGPAGRRRRARRRGGVGRGDGHGRGQRRLRRRRGRGRRGPRGVRRRPGHRERGRQDRTRPPVRRQRSGPGGGGGRPRSCRRP